MSNLNLQNEIIRNIFYYSISNSLFHRSANATDVLNLCVSVTNMRINFDVPKKHITLELIVNITKKSGIVLGSNGMVFDFEGHKKLSELTNNGTFLMREMLYTAARETICKLRLLSKFWKEEIDQIGFELIITKPLKSNIITKGVKLKEFASQLNQIYNEWIKINEKIKCNLQGFGAKKKVSSITRKRKIAPPKEDKEENNSKKKK